MARFAPTDLTVLMVGRGRILVVDDEEQIARLLTRALNRDGHEAEFATEPREALERIRQDSFDLLVTDLRMPGLTGLELIEAARKHHPTLEALIITAYASAESAVDALRHGVADYVMKPFTTDQVRDAVRRALAARERRKNKEKAIVDLTSRVETASADLERRVADVSFLHDLTRLIAGRKAPLRNCLALLRGHFSGSAVVLTDKERVTTWEGDPDPHELVPIALRARREESPVHAPCGLGYGVAAPFEDGAVAVARERSFDGADLQLLEIAGRDLALAVENDRLRAEHRHAYVAIVATLIEAVEAKDRFNKGHSRRVAALARNFAERLRLPLREREILETAAKLHDIGKIGIPEEILNKPGRLSDREFQVIQDHPTIGERILAPLDFLAEIRPIVRHHHERWDGAGYPDGLSGEEIPHPAAVLAIVDAYDAMISDRPYRRGLSPSQARDILQSGAGTQWDPDLIQRFQKI
ncbi:MAG: response regulator [Planctomycetota bacterium]|nr:response regulator [Planctomycetota bacterium]